MEYGTQESCFVPPHSLLWAKASSEPHFISLSFHGNQTYFMNSQKITLSQTMGLFPEQMKSRGFSSLANGKGTLSDYPAATSPPGRGRTLWLHSHSDSSTSPQSSFQELCSISSPFGLIPSHLPAEKNTFVETSSYHCFLLILVLDSHNHL